MRAKEQNTKNIILPHHTHSLNETGHAMGDRATLPVLSQHGGREGLAYMVAARGSVARMALERQLI